jgi:hypothetical protein
MLGSMPCRGIETVALPQSLRLGRHGKPSYPPPPPARADLADDESGREVRIYGSSFPTRKVHPPW